MNPPIKSASLQAYKLLLYKRALHPEFFTVKSRRTLAHGQYDFETWLMPGSHLMRFQHAGQCVTELVTDNESNLPEKGLELALPCAGERDHEQQVTDKINFMATVQTETLPANLYAATYRELVEFGQESEAMIHLWTDAEGGKCASILDIQRFRKEIHAQAYHLQATGGLVLRTQTIFEHAD